MRDFLIFCGVLSFLLAWMFRLWILLTDWPVRTKARLRLLLLPLWWLSLPAAVVMLCGYLAWAAKLLLCGFLSGIRRDLSEAQISTPDPLDPVPVPTPLPKDWMAE